MRYALVFFAAVILAQSQPPSPSPGKDTKGEQKNSASRDKQVRSDNNQTQPSPITVNQYNSQPDNGDKSQSTAEQNNGAPKNWIDTSSTVLLAVSTLLLAIATVALWVIARRQWLTLEEHRTAFESIATNMGTGLEQTTKAADAAQRSATIASDVFIASHRPKLSVRFMSVTEEYGGHGSGIPVSGVFRLFNTGDTKAVLDQYWFGIIIAKTLPAASPYEGRIGQTLTNYVLSPGDSIGLIFPTLGAKSISTEEYMALGNHRDLVKETGKRPTDTEDLFVVGWASYRDEAKQLRTSGFCHRYDFRTKRFERIDDPDYEYGDQG